MKRTLSALTATLLVALLVLTAGCADDPLQPVTRSDVALAQHSTSASILHVPRDYGSIQEAVDAAREGAIVHVRSGTYHESLLITTPGLRLHASAGVVLEGTAQAGIGVHVLGRSLAEPIPNVEIHGFEIRGFERGVVVQWAMAAQIHRNQVHGNLDMVEPFAFYEGAGIDLIATRGSEVSQNAIYDNGNGGIFLRVGSRENVVQGNHIYGNGTQTAETTLMGSGITVTGAGTHDNRILTNHVEGNYGRGIMISRPVGTTPVTGNQVLQNRVHRNWRSGIAIMDAAAENYVAQNDARGNNLSGLPPCYDCNLVDFSIGGNIWERNLGSFNLTDACMP